MSADYFTMGTSVGVGGLAGFLIGYALKKVLSLAIIVVGVFFAALAYLQYQGIISVDWARLEGSSQDFIIAVNSTIEQMPSVVNDQITSMVTDSSIPLVGSLTGGFVLGFMKG